MARLNRKTQVDDEAPVQHLSNQGERDAAIAKIKVGLADFAAKRKAISKEEKEFKKKFIKDGLNMNVGHFMLAYKLLQLPEDDQDEAMDAIREIFTAVEEDGQVSFITDLQQSRKDKAEANEPSVEEARQLGEADGFKGLPVSACPFKLGRQKGLRVAYEDGWAGGAARAGSGTEVETANA